MGPCAQCGATDNLETHHLVPRCDGGGNGDPQILCHRCHSLPLRQAQGSGQRVELHRQAGHDSAWGAAGARAVLARYGEAGRAFLQEPPA